jgi:hypothetical protein
MVDNQQRDPSQHPGLWIRRKSSTRPAARRAQSRLGALLHASRGSALSRGPAGNEEVVRRDLSGNVPIDIAEWFVVAVLFAAFALVTIVPFILL